MGTEKSQEIFDALDSLLEDERHALIAGDLSAISRLLERKAILFEQLREASPGDPSDLTALQTKVVRNQALLDGALRGIRAVADRMGSLRRIQKSLETYDRSGRRNSIVTGAANKIEKRA